MSRMVRRIDDDEELGEDVMVLGGQFGIVTLHLPGGHPDCMVLHSPQEVTGWDGPNRCRYMEMTCWCLSSITGTDLRATLSQLQTAGSENELWAVMEQSYLIYLERSRR